MKSLLAFSFKNKQVAHRNSNDTDVLLYMQELSCRDGWAGFMTTITTQSLIEFMTSLHDIVLWHHKWQLLHFIAMVMITLHYNSSPDYNTVNYCKTSSVTSQLFIIHREVFRAPYTLERGSEAVLGPKMIFFGFVIFLLFRPLKISV